MRAAFVAVAAVLFGVAACGTGERPFRMVQVCLADTSEVEPMKAVLQDVASANKLPFSDHSTETEAFLKSADSTRNHMGVSGLTVNVGTVGPNRMGFTAVNFNEAPLQIVVGFSKGADPTAARQLSDAVVEGLAQRWRIHEVHDVDRSGAFPLKDCNS